MNMASTSLPAHDVVNAGDVCLYTFDIGLTLGGTVVGKFRHSEEVEVDVPCGWFGRTERRKVLSNKYITQSIPDSIKRVVPIGEKPVSVIFDWTQRIVWVYCLRARPPEFPKEG
jgi:hypothetical protein